MTQGQAEVSWARRWVAWCGSKDGMKGDKA